MKKFFLSSFIIITFIFYAFSQRKKDNINSTITIPLNTSGNNNFSIVNYKDGSYTGDIANAYYGNVQIKVTISGEKITDVQFLDYPKDRRTSLEINTYAMLLLKSEAIQAQSASVDIISGATQTSRAFIESLQTALVQAKNS